MNLSNILSRDLISPVIRAATFAVVVGSFPFFSSVRAASVTVPGTANPWLAGLTNGASGSGGDSAPANSPVIFSGFSPGSILQFSATGLAGFAPGAESGPEGVPNYPVNHSSENGIGAIANAPANALLGVFLDDDQPPLTDLPEALDFGTVDSQNHGALAPKLRQPFFIGDGVTTNGQPQSVIAPAGARRLFLGITDGSGWFNNTGTFLVSVLEGIDPFNAFSYETTSPARTGTPWTFRISEHSLVSGLRLRLQSSATPAAESSWRDLPGGGQMGHIDDAWSLTTSDLPTDAQSFRVVAAAPGYGDRISAALGPFVIGAPLPVVTTTFSGSGKYSLASVSSMQDPTMIIAQAVADSAIYFFIDPARAVLMIQAAMILVAQQSSSALLTIDAGQSLITPGVNVGPNSSLVLKGQINGDVSMLSSLITNDGGSLITNDGGSAISHDGGSLTANLRSGSLIPTTASIIGNDGHSLITNDGGSLINNGGSTLSAVGRPGDGTALTSLAPSRGIALSSIPTGAAPGAFTGLMTINGNFNLAPATALSIAIAGTNTASSGTQEYDQLVVSGRADLSGVIGFGLFDSSHPTNTTGVFQPPVGATFDVVVANQIMPHHLLVRGPIWSDGRHFNWSVVNRPDGKQALRLVATRIEPWLVIEKSPAALQIVYPTNFTGYLLQSVTSLNSTNWTTVAANTNRIDITQSGPSVFFRLIKQP